MIRGCVVAAASVLLLASCATTVPGSPVADPSVGPRPDTGSYPVGARDLGQVSADLGVVLEARRMAETSPLLTEVEPALRYGGQFVTDKRSIEYGLTAAFGRVAADALRARQATYLNGGSERSPVAGSSQPEFSRGGNVGVVRMADEAAARAAAGPALRAAEPAEAQPDYGAKVEAAVPGYPSAVAYSRARTDGRATPVYAFLAHKQFVILIRGSFTLEQVRKYFDLQVRALDAFTPTPADKFGTLPADAPGIARYTLPPDAADATKSGSLPLRAVVLGATDVLGMQKLLTDAGVDAVGQGGNLVYRARDAVAGARLRDGITAAVKSWSSHTEPVEVKDVPGANCFATSLRAESTVKRYRCVVAVGRYVGVIEESRQRLEVVQQVGATYWTLREAK